MKNAYPNVHLHHLPDLPFLTLYMLLFHILCFLFTPLVFLPLFAGDFNRGRYCNAQAVAIYNCGNRNLRINYLRFIYNQIPI